MAFTRFRYDLAREQKHLQESTDVGRYFLSVPGPADQTKYIESPHIRLQKFGANNRTNTINIESDLLGMTRNLTRDHVNLNSYTRHSQHSRQVGYKSSNGLDTDQSRSTHPAWEYRDKSQQRFDYLFENPQNNTQIPFINNLDTRNLEKDNYKPQQHYFMN